MGEHYYTIEIVGERVSMSPTVVRRYTRLGFIAPRAWHGRTPLYSETEVARLRKIRRLTRDLGLNQAGVEVVLRLMDTMDTLQQELASLRKEEP